MEWKDKQGTDQVLVTEADLLGALAYWGVHQDPYNNPRKLDVVLTKLRDIIRTEFEECEMSDFYAKTFSVREFSLWLDKTLKSIPEYEEWNLSKIEFDNGVKVHDENRGGMTFTSRYSNIPKDNDFVDLDACIRNTSRMVIAMANY